MRHYAYRSLRNMTMTAPPKQPLILVLGPTGTGKSELAIELATRFNGEVINGDAMQMYDGLPIITNKVTFEEQKGIQHHLLGFIAHDQEPWRVGLFKRKAKQIIEEIRSRGHLPIVVGGTHYYTQSLLFEDSLINEELTDDGDLDTNLPDQDISQRFPILDGPTEAMLERLREVDPKMANRWHPNDRRKIRRSLEIYLTSGRKASDLYEEQIKLRVSFRKPDKPHGLDLESSQDRDSVLLFWVHADPETLKQRLDRRVDNMLKNGLLDEVKSMDSFLIEQESKGLSVDRTRGIWVSIGWKEFEPYLTALQSGGDSQEHLDVLYNSSIERTKIATRQYAKRQVRWIRLKLMPALRDNNTLDRLFLLDGSDITQWKDRLLEPSIEITTSFLSGRQLRVPEEMSDLAKKYLAREESAENTDLARRDCDICKTTTSGEKQWQDHVSSRRHRALVKRSQRQGATRNPFRTDNNGKPTADIVDEIETS